jgi:hypothetical protein
MTEFFQFLTKRRDPFGAGLGTFGLKRGGMLGKCGGVPHSLAQQSEILRCRFQKSFDGLADMIGIGVG